MGNAPLPESTRKHLEAVDWEAVFPRLVNFAAWRLRTLHWAGRCPPGATTAEDLAADAIESLWSGRRRWDPAGEPKLEAVLRGVVHSMASHLAMSSEHAQRWAGKPEYTGALIPRQELAPDEAHELENLKALLVAGLEDDTEQIVFEYLLDGAPPREVAQYLGVPVSYMYNIVRRIQRRLSKAMEKMDTEGAP